ncbi:MAG: hypothetical protein PGN23_06365 [Sphingomonas adhaesiva]|uniref:hypothetical protein n=1 Tax=Sphingomonas adhaesiva TaxID=28212 RepID=UPI002FF575A3
MTVLLRLSAGPIGWAVAFCLIYGLHGVGCAHGWDRIELPGGDAQRIVLAAAWLACLAATLALALYLSRDRSTPLGRAVLATGWTGFAATLVTFVPLLAVPTCV